MELVTLDVHNMSTHMPLFGFIGLGIFATLLLFWKFVLRFEKIEKKDKGYFYDQIARFSLVPAVIIVLMAMATTTMVNMNNSSDSINHNDAILKNQGFKVLNSLPTVYPNLGETSHVTLGYDGKYYECEFVSPDEPGVISVSCGEDKLSLEDIKTL